ncbi:addiction module protein [Rugosibacter aromaticivorans]|uniref:Addiction module protein n=1 Tax=Rugosibacter aromaticivorans TaxID=1565605 RepID=A0A0C5JAE1_9PROT|nr:Fic family protein [Rugosibacter aromaticivorans]AJP48743.1 addiction module protein [Rugosibacter aromaticivorans]TBR14020.1 MAG: Fic family protein [Rugosibacter sp.]
MTELDIPSAASLEVKAVWQSLAEAHRYLAELKGLCESLPNRAILLDTLAIQEAKDSSEIENIITTHDELYAYDQSGSASPAAKEVQNYITALKVGFTDVVNAGLIRISTILRVQEQVEQNNAGFRKVPGTVLKNQATGAVIYEPPQDAVLIEKLMTQLVDFIHADDDYDPLLRMAIAHHQFESIHPFYDGNGRTGRILNLLILQREGLMELPVLYLSRYITSTKAQYYQLLQSTRETNGWVDWCVYLVKGVAVTARSEIRLIKQLRKLMQATKQRLRGELPRLYSQELLNNLFRYPYTKIEFVEKDLGVSRITAAKHLDTLTRNGFVEKKKIGRTNFYINRPLFNLLTQITLNDE